MNIYGVCVVQDEADVIRESLSRAARFCKRIRVWDLGSTDGTWEILQSLASDQIEVVRKEGLPYTSSLRGNIAAEIRGQVEAGAWIYILDADEFLVGDPGPILAAAEQEGASLVGVWQANFFPTPQTLDEIQRLGEESWARQPLPDRFRHYRVEWFEWRFVR
ncbi:MAG: glycosyltransferase family 2 protein, partial [Verrucomicrobia bacterium]|nr:glycosyltransferase family 2 protein [Verrucomicrobiota bacterium]